MIEHEGPGLRGDEPRGDTSSESAFIARVFEETLDVILVIREDGEGTPRCETATSSFPTAPAIALLPGMSVEEILPPSLLRRFTAYRDDALDRGRPVRYEERLEVDGREMRLDAVLTPVLDERGEPSHLFWSARNVTDQWSARESLRRAESQIEELGERLRSLEERAAPGEAGEVAALEERAAAATRERDDALARLASQEEEIRSLQSRIEQVVQERAQLRDRAAALEQERASLDGNATEAEATRAALENERDEARGRLTDLERQRDEAMERSAMAEAERERLAEQTSALEEQIAALERERGELKTQTESFDRDHAGLRDQVAGAEEARRTAEQERDDARERMTDLQRERDEARGRLTALERERDEARERLAEQTSPLEEQIATLERERGELRARTESFDRDQAGLRDQVAGAEEARRTAEQERDQARERLNDLERERDEATERAAAAEAERERLAGHASSLEEHRIDLERRLGEAHEARQALERERDEGRARVAELEREREQIERRMAEAERHRAEIEERIATVLRERDELRDRIEGSDRERESLAAKATEATRARDELQQRLGAEQDLRRSAEQRIAELESSHRDLEARVADALAARRQADEERAELEAEHVKLEERAAELRGERETFAERVTALEEETADADERIRRSEDSLRDAQDEARRLKDQIHLLEEGRSALEEEGRNLARARDELRDRVDALADDRARLEERTEGLEAERDALQDRISSMEEEQGYLERRLASVQEHRESTDARASFLFDQAITAAAWTDPEGKLAEVAPAFASLISRHRDELVGIFLSELVAVEDRDGLARLLGRFASRGEASDSLEMRIETEGGTRRVRATVSARVDPSGAVDRLLWQLEDLTEREAADRRLAESALQDELTGLAGRPLLLDRLSRSLDRLERSPSTLAVMVVDLDRFSVVNEREGREIGDRVLQHVAARLADSVRAVDTVGRLEGDRFAVVCEDLAAPDEAQILADRLRASVEAEVTIQDRTLRIEASVGVALTENAGDAADTLLRDAAAAAREAKLSRQDRMEIYDQARRSTLDQRAKTEGDLLRAMDREEFRVFYQPLVDLRTGQIDGVEALVRWQQPDRGLVTPDEFLGLAEEAGLIVRLGTWVFEQACRQSREWSTIRGGPFTTSVNFSPRQLAQRELPQVIERILGDTGADPASLAIEVPEQVLLAEDGPALATMESLRDLGIHVAIDDFGKGFSSLSYLSRLPADELKLDIAFVRGLGSNQDDEAVAAAVVNLARAMKLSCTAEGVETPQQLARLRELGCDRAQGYLFSSAQPAVAVQQLLSQDLRW